MGWRPDGSVLNSSFAAKLMARASNRAPCAVDQSTSRRRNSPSVIETLHRDDRIGPAECEGIANSGPDWTGPRATGCHIEIAFGIEFLDVDRGWNNTAADRFYDGDQLECTTRAERVAVH